MTITTVTRQQFITALADINAVGDVYFGLSADAEYPDWIEFYSANEVKVGDPLYVATQMALNYTSDQMAALFAVAVQVPA
jgi:hypothetical protein